MKNPIFHADGSTLPRSFFRKRFTELTISVFLEELFTTSILGAGIMFTPRYPPGSRVFTKVNPGPQYTFSDGSIQFMAVTKQVTHSYKSPFYVSMLFWYLPQGVTNGYYMEYSGTERYSIISPSPPSSTTNSSNQTNPICLDSTPTSSRNQWIATLSRLPARLLWIPVTWIARPSPWDPKQISLSPVSFLQPFGTRLHDSNNNETRGYQSKRCF